MASPARIPFLVVIAILALATICAAAVQLSESVPVSPWESATAMEAMRLNAGLPVYETAHATHMYGPLLTALLALVFQIFGLNLLAARIVMSILALALVIFLSAILCDRKNRDCSLLAVPLFLAINFRTNLVLFSTQPDGVSALFAVVALSLWTTRAKSYLRTTTAILFFVCAMLFKQTSAAFALIPLVYALVWSRPLRFRPLLLALVPTMSIFAALVVIRFLWPHMFLAMVTIPASIQVSPARAPGIAFYLIATFPIFLVALLSILRARSVPVERDRWILSALIVLIPVSIWTICKSGGDYNSLLFAYLAMTALFVARFEAIAQWLRALSTRRSVISSSAIALLILVSFFLQSGRAFRLLSARCGDDKYSKAIACAQRLGAGVISPQDPTIAYRANKYFGRSLFLELDAHALNGNWPNELPMSILQEMEKAKHIILVHSFVPTPVFERSLPQHGFRPVAIPELADSAYTVWTRANE